MKSLESADLRLSAHLVIDESQGEKAVEYVNCVYGPGWLPEGGEELAEHMLRSRNAEKHVALAAQDVGKARLQLISYFDNVPVLSLETMEALVKKDAWEIFRWLHDNLPFGTIVELKGMMRRDSEWNSK